jgi:ABC-type multidrug transport system permease subunit
VRLRFDSSTFCRSLIPRTVLISLLFSFVAYWLGNFNPTAQHFFIWVLWLFLDLLAAESLVVLVASIIPNFVGALAITAFANGLWMSVGGFLVPLPVLNSFWKYVFHYWDYQTYVFQGMMVNEFETRTYECQDARLGPGQCHCMFPSALQDQCLIPGTAVLQQYGYETGLQAQWLGIMVVIIFGYRIAGWLVAVLRKN